MKTKRKISVVVSVFLILSLVLSVGAFVFIKIGKKIVNIPLKNMVLSNAGQKIIFNDNKKENLSYSYDISNGELTTLSSDGSTLYETKNYKYKKTKTELICENKATKEKTTVYNVDTDKLYNYDPDFPNLSFSFNILKEHNGSFYFYFKDSTKKHGYIYGYNETTKTLSKYKTEGRFSGFYDNFIFVTHDNSIAKIDMDTTEETILFALPKTKSLNGYTQNGISVTENDYQNQTFQLKLYDFDGNIKYSSELITNVQTASCQIDAQSGSQYVITFGTDGCYRLLKFSNDLKTKEVICNNILPKENSCPDLYKGNSLPNTSGYIYNGSKLYYLVVPSVHQSDAFAFCSIDENGKVEVLKYQKKHFMYKIFKPNVIYK